MHLEYLQALANPTTSIQYSSKHGMHSTGMRSTLYSAPYSNTPSILFTLRSFTLLIALISLLGI